MLSNQDISRIVAACRAEFATKQELQEFKDEMCTDFASLIATVDGYSKKADEYFREMQMLNLQVNRHER
jgi:hypothetical protein